jgi:hypothetical protein
MLLGGIIALVTAKVPSFVVGGGKYQVEGTAARLFGILLMSPLPIAFMGAIWLGVFLGEEGTQYAALLEIGVVVVVALLAVILVRVVGQRVEHATAEEALIAKKADGAVMYTVLTGTGLGAVIGCPLAFVYANQALRLIEEHGVGDQYRRKARIAKVVAAVVTLLWVVTIGFVVIAALVP